MKKFFSDFFLRGLIAASGGPVVLAIIYAALGAGNILVTLTPRAVCIGILSSTLLAMVVGGMTAIYQLERLPLLSAILIHGGVLYLAYILTYLCNGWLQQQWMPVLIFTAIFLVGYALIWLILYFCVKVTTRRINKKLPKN